MEQCRVLPLEALTASLLGFQQELDAEVISYRKTRNYHMIGMYFTTKHGIRVPKHVLSMIIVGLLLDRCA